MVTITIAHFYHHRQQLHVH